MALSTLLASLLCQGVRTRQFLAIADDTSDGRLAQRVRPYTLFFSKRRRSQGLLPAAFVSSDTSHCHPTGVWVELNSLDRMVGVITLLSTDQSKVLSPVQPATVSHVRGIPFSRSTYT